MYTIISSAFMLSFLAAPGFKGHAYLDPGSGSILIQVLIATLLGAAFLVKTYWQKIINFFKRSPEPGSEDGEEPKDRE